MFKKLSFAVAIALSFGASSTFAAAPDAGSAANPAANLAPTPSATFFDPSTAPAGADVATGENVFGFEQEAADAAQAALDAAPPARDNVLAAPSDADAIAKWGIQLDPTTCGGTPAPHLRFADGYRTVCVNGALRFVSYAHTYAYKLTVFNTTNGTKTLVSTANLQGALGMPLMFSSTGETGYIKSATYNAANDQYVATTDRLVTGLSVSLDPKGIAPDGKLILDSAIQNTELLSLEHYTDSSNLDIDVPTTRTTFHAGSFSLPLNQTFELQSGNDTEVDIEVVRTAD